jgi:hypothetical protein
MGTRTTSTRAAALRKARDAKARRDAERLVREQKIEAALTDFFEASGRAAQIRADGKQRAEKVLTDAEATAAESDQAARRAVRALRDLDQANAEIAELCGLSVTAVRAMANGANESDPPGGRPVASSSGPASAPERQPEAVARGLTAGAGGGYADGSLVP